VQHKYCNILENRFFCFHSKGKKEEKKKKREQNMKAGFYVRLHIY
jgi:hypothetical protein